MWHYWLLQLSEEIVNILKASGDLFFTINSYSFSLLPLVNHVDTKHLFLLKRKRIFSVKEKHKNVKGLPRQE